MKYVLDTNVLIEFTDMLVDLDGELIVCGFVLEELDNLKVKGGEIGYKARAAMRYLREKNDKIFVCFLDISGVEMPESLDMGKMDNKILAVAKMHEAVVVSGDFAVLYKAKEILGLDVIDAFTSTPLYSGVKEILFSAGDTPVWELYLKHKESPNRNVFNLYPNQYLILYDKERETRDKEGNVVYKKLDRVLRWTGKDFRELLSPPDKIMKPLNDYQACAIDLAMNPDIPIKVLAGTYGSGKTLIGVRAAAHLTKDKGLYSKILCVRNPMGDTDSADIGFLPGDKEDKVEGFFKGLVGNLVGGEFEKEILIRDEMIDFEIPYYMKGMSLENTFVLVDEAEDLITKTLKLIGTRLGKGSCVCFCGDYKQAESRYKTDNGLMKLIESGKGSDMVGCVVLKDDVRSSASKFFADSM